MALFDNNPSDFYFNIDNAWKEIMYVFNWFSQFTFSFTTYELHLNGGNPTWTEQVHVFKLIHFLGAFLIFTTLDDVLFWWNNAYHFGSGAEQYSFDDDE